MIKGLGIDIVKVSRIKKIIDKWGINFLKKVFTPDEIEYCESKARKQEYYAARFAAKEAAVKMLGIGEGISWQDIEVRKMKSGKPELVLKGKALQTADDIGIKYIHISLSHEREMAIAEIIGEGDI
ncbi:MAG: holo-ACP synthase [Halanaerobiaceae bacterium]